MEVNGYQIGSGADLAGADLTDADLSSVDLSDAWLGGALLTGSNLSESHMAGACLLYTSPSPRDLSTSRMPSSA